MKNLSEKKSHYSILILIVISTLLFTIFFIEIHHTICGNSLKSNYQLNYQINFLTPPLQEVSSIFCSGEIQKFEDEFIFVNYSYTLYFFSSQILVPFLLLIILKKTKLIIFIFITVCSSFLLQLIFNYFVGLNIFNEIFIGQSLFLILLKILVENIYD